MTIPLTAAFWFQAAPGRLLAMRPVDLAIIILYFVLVLGIGFYLKRYAKTGEDFFMAGREMTAWIAGLSFICSKVTSPSRLAPSRVCGSNSATL